MHKSKPIQKGFLCEYQISVTTGDCNGASTNAPIRIKLYGTNGHTNFHELSHSKTHHTPFLKDQTDLFTLQTYHVGELIGITIGHDRKDMRKVSITNFNQRSIRIDLGASWFLNKVSIDDPSNHTIYGIPCNVWLSIKSHDQKTMRDFPVVSKTSTSPSRIIPFHLLLILHASLDHREESESQCDTSTTITEHSGTSTQSTDDHKPAKKSRKQQHVSIGPTTISEKPTTATIETHFNPDDLPAVPSRRMASSILSTTSSDTEIEGTLTNRTPSTTTTPSPTFNQPRLQSVSEHETLQTKSTTDMFKRQSIDNSRPPARLEKRQSSTSTSPAKDENEFFSFFQ